MKKFLNKVSVLMMGCVMAMMATACHTGGDDVTTTKVTPTVKNSLRGIILDQDGAILTGATVKINGKTVSVTGNTFESLGLNNGSYKIEVSLAGYKSAEETITLSTSTEIIDGEAVVVGQNAENIFYLIRDERKTVNFGLAGDEETVTLETSTQDDGTGKIVGNTQEPENESLNTEIVVTASVPGMDADQVKKVEEQLPAGIDIQSLSFLLTNLGSLNDATKKNATRTLIVAGEALPNNYTFFAGVQLVPTYTIDFSSIPGFTFSINIDLPGDVKDAIKLYRNMGSGWTEVTKETTGNGITSVDFSKESRITVNLNKLEFQSFAIGVQIDQTDESADVYPFTTEARVNNTSSPMLIKSLPYTAKTPGIVLTNLTTGAMVDYLRKIILRYYRIRAIYEAKDEDRVYDFTTNNSSGYSLPAGGELYLTGYQNVKTSVFSIINGTSSFKAEQYGDMFVYPYALIPTPVHSGGSND